MFWIALALVLIVLGVLLAAKRQRSRNVGAGESYSKHPVLFSPAERSFLGVLDRAVGKDFRVFGKVRVSDVLAPRTGMQQPAHTAALNQINRKHFDFVLCNPDDLQVLCAIELNDASHQRKSRRARDEFLVEACRGAGLPLVMFDARHAYSPVKISARIAEAIAGQVPRCTEPTPQTAIRQDSRASVPENEVAPLCPRCSGTMVKQVARGGDNAGKEFWGCSNFPTCREIVTI